uniref:DNA helicase n=1 Tax=Oncorhynchus mykiss TaxID=8022 RepID=A0A8C7LQ82_ONCMY
MNTYHLVALIGQVFEAYVTEHHTTDIMQILLALDEDAHYSVVSNTMTLFEANMEVGDYFNTVSVNSTQQGWHKVKHHLHARITDLPLCPELTRENIPKSRNAGHFLFVTDTVIRTSVTKVLEYKGLNVCHCGPPFPADLGVQVQAVCGQYSMVVILEDDLVDSCKSGNTGHYDFTSHWSFLMNRNVFKGISDITMNLVDLVLKANFIEVNNEQTMAALVLEDMQKEKQILMSLCPRVFGMYVVKLSVAMVLAGGVQRIDPSGTKVRGILEMLLQYIHTIVLRHDANYFVKCTSPSCSKAPSQHDADTPVLHGWDGVLRLISSPFFLHT